MVTLVRRWRRKHGISIDGCRSYKRRLHNNGGSWRMWLDKWRQPLWINILVSMHSIGNLISIVSSDTPVGAKVVKGVILRGVLDVNEDCWKTLQIWASPAVVWLQASFYISINWQLSFSCFLWSSTAIPWLRTQGFWLGKNECPLTEGNLAKQLQLLFSL